MASLMLWAAGAALLLLGCDDVPRLTQGRASARAVMLGRLALVFSGALLWRLA